MSFSTASFSNASDSVRDMIRHEIFTAGTNAMDVYSRKSHYTVYEYMHNGHILTSHFISSNDAFDYVDRFCMASSKVYVMKTTCEEVFEPRSSSANVVSTSDSHKHSNALVDYNSEEDSDFDPDCCSGSDTSESESEELSDEELTDEDDDVDLSEMFFSVYGKGFILHPPTGHELTGTPYFLDGWWMNKHNGWFFKAEFEDKLLSLGAMKVTEKKTKSKSSSKTSSKSSSKTSKSSSKTSKSSSKTSSKPLSGMTFTKYGKGYILTTDETDSRYGTKYLLDDVDSGGFWNSNANGWFFRKMHFDLLKESGAQYIKSEDNYQTSDNLLDVKPNFKAYGKGFFLKADKNFKYTGEEMNYYEGGWYMPSKKGWFFKKAAGEAFMKKYNMH